ncbi:MAG TPA: hypothetical protein VKR53_05235 [Puia sp.]|nr:hypothetical protein [Puia sp.]
MFTPDGDTYYIVLFVLVLSVICVGALMILFLYSLFFKKKSNEPLPVEEANVPYENDELMID